MLQHKGTMRGGRYEMIVTVVPDSGQTVSPASPAR